ncbi:hypothetical protein [Kitasatospora purpeofusca]|uniref:hypothetical protein n=1 Tax=Kitasatospora purpeofusca TaxID=67352 RepID=UPI0036624351
MQHLADMSIQSGQILGSLGTGGAALLSTTLTIVGIRGKKKFKITPEAAPLWGLIDGTLYMSAASFWTAPDTITTSVTGSITGPDGPFGTVGLGAVAGCITALALYTDISKGKKATLGIGAASVFTQAGGIWGIFPVFITSLTGKALGVH